MQMTEEESDEDSTDESKSSQEAKKNAPLNPLQILQVGQESYGRSISNNPVDIPVDMMESRPHYVQPRSIRED